MKGKTHRELKTIALGGHPNTTPTPPSFGGGRGCDLVGFLFVWGCVVFLFFCGGVPPPPPPPPTPAPPPPPQPPPPPPFFFFVLFCFALVFFLGVFFFVVVHPPKPPPTPTNPPKNNPKTTHTPSKSCLTCSRKKDRDLTISCRMPSFFLDTDLSR